MDIVGDVTSWTDLFLKACAERFRLCYHSYLTPHRTSAGWIKRKDADILPARYI